MNRFFRSAFFPLIVIVLLVWLASQTLIPKHSHAYKNIQTYSQLKDAVKQDPGQFSEIVFNPSRRAITAKITNPAATVTVHYPSDQSQVQFENLLDKEGVTYDSKGTGGFSWTSLIGSFWLPRASEPECTHSFTSSSVWKAEQNRFLRRLASATASGGAFTFFWSSSNAPLMSMELLSRCPRTGCT